MAHINLLPWRERLREERKREFFTIVVGMVIISAGVLFLVDRYFNGEIDMQTSRNDFIRAEIAVLDERVAEINQLRQQKEDIRSRMNVITDLQGTRPVIVRIFDELVNTLPDGVYYESLVRVDNTISIEGVAESYARITELLRRLDDSELVSRFRFRRYLCAGCGQQRFEQMPLHLHLAFLFSYRRSRKRCRADVTIY